jgi:hypothetical protein
VMCRGVLGGFSGDPHHAIGERGAFSHIGQQRAKSKTIFVLSVTRRMLRAGANDNGLGQCILLEQSNCTQ